MSDCSDDFMVEDESDDFGSDDSGSESNKLENSYYNAKAKLPDPQALTALKQIFKATRDIKVYNEILQAAATRKDLSKNYVEKTIQNILDRVDAAASSNLADEQFHSTQFIHDFYSNTIAALESMGNDRLLAKTNIKLAKLWLAKKEYIRLAQVCQRIKQSCLDQDQSGSVSGATGMDTLLLEVYAIEIQMYTDQQQNGIDGSDSTRASASKMLKSLYAKCLEITSAISHPNIMGVIRECGGKMHMREGEWARAQEDFFEAFKNYDESGSPQRITCLKYLVIANMLSESRINPFDSQETKPYKNDADVVAMTGLVDAFQAGDLARFLKIQRENKRSLNEGGDSFTSTYMPRILQKMRGSVLVKMIRPYTRVKMAFLADALAISEPEAQELLVELILDDRVPGGKIDQVARVLMLPPAHGASGSFVKSAGAVDPAVDDFYRSVGSWASSSRGLLRTVAGF
ncbi:MAG: hypothetical protein SGCHY_004810 [Lobulomycetales sp.]